MDNKYYGHFKAVTGGGVYDGYYTNMGQVYKTRPGVQRGYGHHMVNPRLSSRQRGLGFGSTLMSMFRMAAPILRALGSKAVDVVSNVAKDAIQGSNIKESVVKRGKDGVNDIIAGAPAAFTGLVTKGVDTDHTSNSQTSTSDVLTTRHQPAVIKRRKKTYNAKTVKRRRGGQYTEGLALLQ